MCAWRKNSCEANQNWSFHVSKWWVLCWLCLFQDPRQWVFPKRIPVAKQEFQWRNLRNSRLNLEVLKYFWTPNSYFLFVVGSHLVVSWPSFWGVGFIWTHFTFFKMGKIRKIPGSLTASFSPEHVPFEKERIVFQSWFFLRGSMFHLRGFDPFPGV